MFKKYILSRLDDRLYYMYNLVKFDWSMEKSLDKKYKINSVNLKKFIVGGSLTNDEPTNLERQAHQLSV